MKILMLGITCARLGAAFFEADKGNNPPFAGKDVGEMNEREFREGLASGFEQIGERQKNIVAESKQLSDKLAEALNEIKAAKEVTEQTAAKLREVERGALLRARGKTEGDYGSALFRRHEKACELVGKAFCGPAGDGTGSMRVEIRGETETNTSGQAILNPELTLDIYDTLLSYGSFREFDNRRMSSKQQKLIVKNSRPTAYFIPESGEYIPSAIGLASLFLTAQKIGVLDAFSREMVQDSPIEIGAMVLDDFAMACAGRMDYAVYLGDGTTDAGGLNGGITGIVNAGLVVSTGAGHTTIGATTSDDWLKPLLAVDQAVLMKKPEWRLNATGLAALLGVKATDGRPIFQDAFQAPSYGAIGSIFGFPVKMAAVLPYNNSAGQTIATFGDPKAVAVGLRQDFNLAFSDDVYFTSNQRAYRGDMRGTAALKKSTAQVVLKLAAT